MHGLPPAILDENVGHLLIAGTGRDSSPPPVATRSSTASEDGVGVSPRSVHSLHMITALAHSLVTIAVALGISSGVWPLAPRPEVVEGFSPPASTWGAGHRGVDLAGRIGQRVRATEAGTVTFAGLLAGRGVVVVDHGTTRTTYEPVRSSVHIGDRVAAAATIGTLQLFGSHCFPRACLHWGLIKGDTYLDPLSLVGSRPIRLLPLYSPLGSPLGSPVPATSEPATPWGQPAQARGWAWR